MRAASRGSTVRVWWWPPWPRSNCSCTCMPAAIVRVVRGDSLAAIRFLPALAGAGLVLLTGLIARELGGKRFAQGLAALCSLAAPGFLALDNFLSMNAFEPLFWMGCAWLVIRMARTGNTRLWLWFGMLAGVGLENKYSMLIFGLGIVAGGR